MDSEVGRIRESYFVPHDPGRGGRQRERGGERFRIDEDAPPRAAEDDAEPEANEHHEHGRVGRPDDDEAGRSIDLIG